jgi:hypothetical protein
MSSDAASLSLRSALPSMEFSLLDGSFTEVAHGIGGLEEEALRPGIYELRASAGPVATSRLIRLAAGEHFDDLVELEFPSAVPAAGTSTFNEEHAAAASLASQNLMRADGGDGGLVVMARALSAYSAADPQSHFTVVGSSTRTGEVRGDTLEGADWRLQAARVEPGGYVLHVVRDGVTLAQSLWVQAGWQTIVFMSAGPRGPNPSKASILMCPLQDPWVPWDKVGSAAAELALWGLRDRRSVLPPDFLNVLLYGKFRNPVFGLLGAHALLLESEVDFRRFDVVMGNLDELTPGAPDVAALRAMGAEARRRERGTEPDAEPSEWMVDWPPMLLAGYLAVLRADARRQGQVIVRGSLADRIGANLTAAGVWTSWTEEPARRRERAGASEAVGDAGESSPVAQALRGAELTDPAIERVADYLASVADFRRPASVAALIDDLDPRSVSAATHLPYRSVLSAFVELIHQAG